MNTIDVANFKAFKVQQQIVLDDKNAVFFGENGSGKSSLFDVFRVCFHRTRLFDDLIPASVTLPADRTARENDILNSFNNQSTPLTRFGVKVDGLDYSGYPRPDDDVCIINSDVLAPEDVINVDILIGNAMVNVSDGYAFVASSKTDIEDLVNVYIHQDFHEPNIEFSLVERDAHWRVALKDSKRMSFPVSDGLASLFNEAKLRIVKFLILSFAILNNNLHGTATKHMIVFDDIVGSMDSANRSFIVRFIYEYFKSYQLVILTHSPSFFNLLSYSFRTAWGEKDKWKTYQIVEKDGDSIIVSKVPESTSSIRYVYGDEVNVGNKLRQRFEYLVEEFSKLVCVGGISETGRILNAINTNEDIYFKYQAHNRSKDVYDMIKEIRAEIYADTSGSAISSRLKSIIADYTANGDITQLKNTLSEIRIYQKNTLHPLSHSTGFSPMVTSREVERSIALLLKLEDLMNNLVGRDVYSC